MPAFTHLGVSHHLCQAGIGVFFERRAVRESRLLDEKRLQVAVRGAVQERAIRRLSVAPRSTGLLVVGLQASGRVVVDDATDVGDIDTHAKS